MFVIGVFDLLDDSDNSFHVLPTTYIDYSHPMIFKTIEEARVKVDECYKNMGNEVHYAYCVMPHEVIETVKHLNKCLTKEYEVNWDGF